ncbi:MAG: InlB B-repeat-containing protein, partial [Methanocorpusculum sp.]|nr:InlB B-repeat-containing protein [Methanocorpusculum sp.]
TLDKTTAYVGDTITATITGSTDGPVTITYPVSLGGGTEDVTITSGTATGTAKSVVSAASGDKVSAKGTGQEPAVESAAFTTYAKAITLTAPASQTAGTVAKWTVSIPLAANLTVTLAEDTGSSAGSVTGLGNVTFTAGGAISQDVNITASAAGTLKLKATADGWAPGTGSVTVTDIPATYTATYVAGEGVTGNVPVDSAAYSAGDQVTVLGNVGTPAPLTKEGYTFNGWKDLDDTARAAGSTFSISKNMTLTSQWTANEYTVTYSYTGTVPAGAPAVPAAADYAIGAQVTVADAPTLAGYTFSGWSTDDATISDGKFTMPAKAVTLKGSWTAKTTSVTFNTEGSTGGTAPAATAATYGSAAPDLGSNTLVKTGYTFGGWAVGSSTGTLLYDGNNTVIKSVSGYTDASGNWISEAASVELHAKWTANTYSVKFNKGEGTCSDMPNQTLTYDAGPTKLSKNTYTAPTGKVFAGWAKPSGGAVEYADEAEVSNLTAENNAVVDLYAIWSNKAAKSITKGTLTNGDVTISSDEAGQTVISQAVEGTTVYLKPVGNTGYTHTANSLAAKYNDGSEKTLTPTETSSGSGVYKFTMPDFQVTVTAGFTANTYTIAYKDQGDAAFSGTHEAGYPTTHTYGTATTLKSATKTGYTFGGWFDSKECSGSAVTSIAATTENPVLYAKWTPKEYTITYKDQGGAEFSGTHETGYPTTHTYGTATTLKSATKTGYTFGGWFDSKECSGSAVTSIAATAENPVLYAKWTANTYTVSYKDLDNQTYSGDNLDSLVKTHTYGTDTTLVSGTKTDTDTTKFMFEGWFDSSACTGTKIPTLGATAYTADITLYAKWIQTITPTGGKAQIPSGEQKIVPVAPSSPEVKMIEVDGVNGEVTFSQTSAVPTPTAPSQGYTDLKVFAKFEIGAITGADTRFVIDIKNQHGIYSSKNIFLRHHSTGGWDDKHIEGTQLSAETGTLRLSFPVKECSPFAIVYETPVKKSGGSSSSQGSSTWLTEPAAAEQPAVTPTPTPTLGAVETPGVKPVNPSEIPAKTPAPFVGILAGLGCAAALFSLRRK